MKDNKSQSLTDWINTHIKSLLIKKLINSVDQNKLKDWLVYARQRDIVLCALKMAAIVGTVLMLINHGEELIFFRLTTLDWIQIGLTYLVPYSVSTYSSVETARRHHEQQ